MDNSIGVVTALNPALGYERTSEIAREALETGKPIADIVLDRGYLTSEELNDLLSPEKMTRPRYADLRRPIHRLNSSK